MGSAGKQRTLRNETLRAAQVSGCFASSQSRVLFPQKSKKPLCASKKGKHFGVG